MDKKLLPSLAPQKINKDNFEYFHEILPYKSEIIDGEIYFDEGGIKVEELLNALIYYIGIEKTVELVQDKELWRKAVEKIDLKNKI